MTNYFDDDSFWDEHASESTSEITRVNRRTPERTRSHHVVKRDATPLPMHYDDHEDELWLEPVARSSEHRGSFGNIDPRLLSVGAVALVAMLAVPLFGALGEDGGDDTFRSIAEAQATTTTGAPTTAPIEIVIPAPVNPIESDSAESDSSTQTSDAGSDSSDASSASSGQSAAAPAALRAPSGCSNSYEIAAGDFWLGIAEKAGVSLDDLLAANDATAETMLFPGSDMCLPSGSSIGGGDDGGGGTAPAPATCAVDYEVKAGEFWVSIAESAGVSLDDLLVANNATKDTAIFPGSDICLPAGATPPATPAPTTAAPITQPATTPPPTADPPTTEPATTTDPSTTQPATTEPRVTDPPPSGGEIEQMIRDVWPDDLEQEALRIAWRESNYRPDVTSSTGCCVGVFQMHWEAHRSWLDNLGVTSRDQLFDARTNIEAAYALYQRNGGWGPWAL